ncbi:MAG: hypothetical protein J0M19_16090 [Sphingomonadales bacterium]|nr:hypothetical protein [Sphingomonadales bacterium]
MPDRLTGEEDRIFNQVEDLRMPDSVSAKEIVNLVREKGMLAKQLYIVSTTPAGSLDKVMEMVENHLDYQVDLERRGIMFAAGPNWTDDEKEWKGDGTVVIRAGSMAEAHALMEADPMHSSGARKFTIRPWLVDEGRLSVELDFSTGKFRMA